MAIKAANDKSMSNITALPSGVSAKSLILLSTFTSDGSDDTATFASSIDSTYKEYLFVYTGVHPQTDNAEFTVNFRDGSTAYDATKTTTYFNSYHDEADSGTGVGYNTDMDLAQATGVQNIIQDCGADNDQAGSGYLCLFDPSSTTFVKHFYGRSSNAHGGDYAQDIYFAGYCNVTAAIDGVQFKFSSGEIQAGVIKMYGVV